MFVPRDSFYFSYSEPSELLDCQPPHWSAGYKKEIKEVGMVSLALVQGRRLGLGKDKVHPLERVGYPFLS